MASDATRLDGRVAVVTGAGRGIGRSIALALAGAGADVVLAARSADQLEQVASDVGALGRRALPVSTDVTRAEQIERLVDATIDGFGRIDVLVNNSGVLRSRELLDTSDDEWDLVFDTNLRGAVLATRAAGKHLVAQGSGKVINVASHFAFKGVAQHAAYCASKAALVAFTRCMAIEWARHNIQVNALCPGYFATDLNADLRADEATLDRMVRGIPARRIGDPNELGPWAVLLASSASDFMTGEAIVVDGGQVAR